MNCLDGLMFIPDNSIDLIITDPPYDISATNGGGSVNNIKKLNKSLKQLVDAGIDSGYDIPLYCTEFIRVMKEINIYIWCNKKQIPEYFDFFVNKNKCTFDILFWNKPNALPTYSNKYLTDCEYVLYFRKGRGKCFPQCYKDAKTCYVAPINHSDKKQWNHPTIKPLGFTESMIKNSSRSGDIVLDPFIGSGTTAVAAILNDRQYIGFESSQEYCSVAEKRIQATIDKL